MSKSEIKIDDPELIKKIFDETGVEDEPREEREIPDITSLGEIPDIILGYKRGEN